MFIVQLSRSVLLNSEEQLKPIIVRGHTAKYFNTTLGGGDRGSTVVKVLCYKSEGRWFDPS